MSMPGLFMDPDGEPLRFFLPMSLASRASFKEKIEQNGGVLVQSELMTNIIKIGDPAKPQSYDASWLNFRYIDDAIRQGQLQNPEFYVMSDPMGDLTIVREIDPMPVTQRETPSNGTLPNGVGSRGTRMEFTPEEDDVLRRIVHRPGVATSGNKIYQLIAQQYGGHSFHSWRDRYIRHMRPIWGPPTDDCAMDVNTTDDFILTQSYLRAPHVSNNLERRNGRNSTSPDLEASEDQLRTPATPPIFKKQRAAFSTTDDEILLRAIVENGETAPTYKMLGTRHPHHTWESWKNRVKALKKKNKGVLPDPDRTPGGLDISDLSNSNLDLDMPLESQAALSAKPQIHEEQEAVPDMADPNIDPNLQQLQHLTMIMDDPNQQVFEEQFGTEYDPHGDLQMQQQLQDEETSASPFDFQPTTEDMLRHNLRGDVPTETFISHRPPSKRRGAARPSAAGQPSSRTGKRRINIHDPTADENAGPVSDIEDGTQEPDTKKSKRQSKKRKTTAAAFAAANRAAAVPKLKYTPMTPSRQLEEPAASNVKSAKQEHHERERTGLVKAVRDDLSQDFVVEVSEPRTRAAKARAASQEPQPADRGVGVAVGDEDEDALRAEQQIKRPNTRDPHRSTTRQTAQALPQIDEIGFMQTNDLMQADFSMDALRPDRSRILKEVRATPDSSPVRPPVSQLRNMDTGPDADMVHFDDGAFEPPSPTPTSPHRHHGGSFSQSQFLQDTQAIRGDLDFDFETTIDALGRLPSDDAHLSVHATETEELGERRANWIAREVTYHDVHAGHAAAAWDQTCGVEALADKVAEAYRDGHAVPRLPGIWTEEDDRIIQGADAAAMTRVDDFHDGTGESRLLFLASIGR